MAPTCNVPKQHARLARAQLPRVHAHENGTRRGGQRGYASAKHQSGSLALAGAHGGEGLDRAHLADEYGGAGLDQASFLVLLEELQRINARPPLGGMGVTMIGPTLLEYGSEEQKLRHLPAIARGEVAWCQGYSEPGAGSDLASLKTKAEDKGDHYLVNGSKIWTSGANHADWIFCLVRTDFDCTEAPGDQLSAVLHGQPGGHDQTDRAAQWPFTLLSDVLR